ncbi:MAG: hypothetical protein ACYTGZ_14085 [Planctomycetota bacterium]|jgi:hypothetical protein
MLDRSLRCLLLAGLGFLAACGSGGESGSKPTLAPLVINPIANALVWRTPNTSAIASLETIDGDTFTVFGVKDNDGLPTAITNAKGRMFGDGAEFEVEFDAGGRVTRISTSDGATAEFNWSDTDVSIVTDGPEGRFETTVALPEPEAGREPTQSVPPTLERSGRIRFVCDGADVTDLVREDGFDVTGTARWLQTDGELGPDDLVPCRDIESGVTLLCKPPEPFTVQGGWSSLAGEFRYASSVAPSDAPTPPAIESYKQGLNDTAQSWRTGREANAIAMDALAGANTESADRLNAIHTTIDNSIQAIDTMPQVLLEIVGALSMEQIALEIEIDMQALRHASAAFEPHTRKLSKTITASDLDPTSEDALPEIVIELTPDMFEPPLYVEWTAFAHQTFGTLPTDIYRGDVLDGSVNDETKSFLIYTRATAEPKLDGTFKSLGYCYRYEDGQSSEHTCWDTWHESDATPPDSITSVQRSGGLGWEVTTDSSSQFSTTFRTRWVPASEVQARDDIPDDGTKSLEGFWEMTYLTFLFRVDREP